MSPPKSRSGRPSVHVQEKRRAGERRARSGRCRICEADVLVGLDASVAAGEVVVDPVAVDAVQEVLALASGRASFTARRLGPDVELTRRTQWNVQGSPGSGPHPVYLSHRCQERPQEAHQEALPLDLEGPAGPSEPPF